MQQLFVSRTAGLVMAGLVLIATDARADDAAECIASHENAQRLRKRGELRAARRQLLACSRAACPSIAKVDCAAWLEEVDRELPTIVPAATGPDGRQLVTLDVWIDDERRAELLDGRPLEVDPGGHTIRFVQPDQREVHTSIVVNTGEKNRMVSVRFDDPGREGDAGAPWRTTGFVMSGVGLAALGVFAVFAVSGQVQYDDLEAKCAEPGARRPCDPDEADAIDTKFLVADVSLVIGLASAAAAGVFFGLSALSSSQPRAPTAGVVLAPSSSGMSIGCAGRF